MNKKMSEIYQLDQTHPRRLIRLYIIALSAIALLTLLGQGLIQWTLHHQLDDSHIINIAGRQRMLSQKLSKAILAIQANQRIAEKQTYLKEFRQALILWEQSHQGLLLGDKNLRLPGKNSPDVIQLFATIEPHYRKMSTAAKALLAVADHAPFTIATIDISPFVITILEEEAHFLKGMDKIVFQYDAEASAKMVRVRIIEVFLMTITLIVLTIEAIYVFHPTTQKITENLRKLQENEESLKALLNAIPESAFLMDIQNGKILSSNQTIAHRLGTTLDQFVGACFFDFLTAEVAEVRKNYVNQVLKNRQPIRFEDIRNNRYLDNSYYPIFNQEGQLTRLAVFSLDMTHAKQAAEQIRKLNEELEQRVTQRTLQLEAINHELQQEITTRKRIEKALQEERTLLAHRVAIRTAELSESNAKLLKAVQTKDEFLASMSHELRTPLTAILGITEALQEHIYGVMNEKQIRSLTIIEESGRHLLSLINDILDLSKIEAGKLELDIQPCSVEAVCRVSLHLIQPVAQKKRLQVILSIDETIITIVADERRLKQILVNLLNNAVKFTPEGGTIRLNVKGDFQQHLIQFIVEDTGIGIAKENLAKLFKPFMQLDGRLSRRYGGVGLGLSLVYRLTEMHGGSIAVTSTMGQGSCFTISLPWYELTKEMLKISKNLPRDVATPNLAILLKKKSSSVPLLLLAEDNESNIETLSNYLIANGYRLIIARNGAEAVEQAQELHPDLILMDIQMPVLDGLEAIRRLRIHPQLIKIPIIALTALVMLGDRERCLEAGANDYLSKPVSLRRLIETIEHHLDRCLKHDSLD